MSEEEDPVCKAEKGAQPTANIRMSADHILSLKMARMARMVRKMGLSKMPGCV
jgi:hypothetical protein